MPLYKSDAESTVNPERRIHFKTLIIRDESDAAHRERWRDNAISAGPMPGASQQKPDCLRDLRRARSKSNVPNLTSQI
jgi:hypothetical protein